MVVGPTKFTIPGLWAGLQDRFMPKRGPTVYQKQVKGVIGQADDEAVKTKECRIGKAKISRRADTIGGLYA